MKTLMLYVSTKLGLLTKLVTKTFYILALRFTGKKEQIVAVAELPSNCSIDNSFKDNSKRFWSALKQTSKSCSIPDRISMPSSPANAFLNEIADFFNTYFASVFTSENLPVQHPNRTDPVLYN
jgi:hypothetical protein